MDVLYLDTETYSGADLKKVGGYAYARHSSTETTLLTWALNDGEVYIVDRMQGEEPDPEFLDLFNNPAVQKRAHNAQFDRWVLQFTMGLKRPVEEWYCTMSKAFTVGLLGALDQLCVTLGVDDDLGKMSEGKKLIRLFAGPQVPRIRRRKDEAVEDFERRKQEGTYRAGPDTHPEEWERFREYAMRDTLAMREVDRKLPEWNYQGKELAVYHLDQRINDRGMPVDLQLAKKAAQICDKAQEALNAELADITDGELTSHSQRDAVMAWLQTRGVPIKGYTKDDVATLLDDKRLKGIPRRVLEIRKLAGRTSTSKYLAFANTACLQTQRIHGALQYYGAMRTGRWSGRNVQPQNFPRPGFKDLETLAEAVHTGNAEWLYDDLMEVGASCLRPVIAAKQGCVLNAGDYSNIEGRKLAWLAGEEWKLQAFRDFDAGIGHDLYKLAYARAFGIPVEDVDDDLRQIGKVMELALGYQGAYGAFVSMAANFGLEIPDEATVIGWVQAWRQAHPRTVQWWYELEDAAQAALTHRGKGYKAGRVAFKVVGRWLLCKLPSGRYLCYFNAKLTRDGRIQYEGFVGNTRKWGVLDIYGGKFAENIDQASSRDVMAYNMPIAEAEGYAVIGTVHDEVITETPADFGSAEGLRKAIGNVPPWCPELPLSVTAWRGKRYRK